MSRTNHRAKKAKCGIGKEYQSPRLPKGGVVPGPFTKMKTHRHERRQAQNHIQESMNDD
jgi:hypothetical protein